MIDLTHMLVTNSEFMFIPIGKVIRHLFQSFDYFQNLCKFITSNILWIIKPAKDEKKKRCWEIVLNAICAVLFYMKMLLSIRSSN